MHEPGDAGPCTHNPSEITPHQPVENPHEPARTIAPPLSLPVTASPKGHNLFHLLLCRREEPTQKKNGPESREHSLFFGPGVPVPPTATTTSTKPTPSPPGVSQAPTWPETGSPQQGLRIANLSKQYLKGHSPANSASPDRSGNPGTCKSKTKKPALAVSLRREVSP